MTSNTTIKTLKRRLLPILCLGPIFLAAVYRAATQSITFDEALDHLWFAEGVFSTTFDSGEIIYVNLHVLYIILTKFAIGLFGLSDFTVRLPALGGTLIYLAALWRLRPVLFQRLDLAILAGALLTLNPFLMDFMPYARGYILALGLSMTAFYLLLTALIALAREARFPARRALAAGLLLALAVLANISCVFPAAAILAGAALLSLAVMFRYARAALWKVLAGLAGAAALLALGAAAAAWAAPYRKLFGAETYYRFDSFSASARGLMNLSFNYAGINTWDESRCGPLLAALTRVAIPATLAWMGLVFSTTLGKILFGHRTRAELAADLPMLFTAAMLLICISGYDLAHVLFGLYFPRGRTGMFLIVFFTLAFSVLAQWHALRGHWFPLQRALALVMMFAAIAYVPQFNTRYFTIFRANADSRAAWSAIRQICERHPREHFNLTVTWYLGAPLSFYNCIDELGNLSLIYAWTPSEVYKLPSELYYAHVPPPDPSRRILLECPVSESWLTVSTKYFR